MCTELSQYYSQCLPGEDNSPVGDATPKPSLRPTAVPTPLPSTRPVSEPTPLPSERPVSTTTLLPSTRPVDEPTDAPVTTPTPPIGGPTCGCGSCTQEVLDRVANGHSCGSRIDWVIANRGFSEFDACALVGGDEFPSICGGCDPNTCNDESPPSGAPTGAPVEPTPPPAPVLSPTSVPILEGILLTTDKALNAWEVFLGLEELTHVNSQNPPNYALVAS